MLEHAHDYEQRPDNSSFVGMRKHLAWYCHGSPGAAELRARMVRLSSSAELTRCLAEYATSIASGTVRGLRCAPKPQGFNFDPCGTFAPSP